MGAVARHSPSWTGGFGSSLRLDWGQALGTGVGAQRGLSFGTKSGSESELRTGA